MARSKRELMLTINTSKLTKKAFFGIYKEARNTFLRLNLDGKIMGTSPWSAEMQMVRRQLGLDGHLVTVI